MAQYSVSGKQLVSPSRWESPHLHRIQRDSRKKRVKQETVQKCFFFLMACCFFVLLRLLFQWTLLVDFFILCSFTGFILQLGSFFVPQRNVASSVLNRSATKPIESPSSLTSRTSLSDQKLPTSFHEIHQFSPSSPNEYLMPFQRDTNIGSSGVGEENVVYQTSHSPIRSFSLPYFHSVSPSLSDNAIWLKYHTISGYPISNENIEKCRAWIVERVIRPFIARIIPFMSCIPYLSSFSGLDLSYLNYIEQRYPFPPIRDAKEEFLFLNRYLSMDSYPSSGEYIFERVLQLAKDNYMSLFLYSDIWKLDEHSFSLSHHVPSDSEIVVHFVSCFIDEVVERCCSGVPNDLVSIRPFSKRHLDMSFPSPLVRSNGNESMLYKLGGWKYRSGAVICFLQRRPPIFAVVGQGGNCLSIPAGRTNVFAAIVGLFKLINEYFDGHLFQVSLSSPYLGIVDWIE